LKTFFYSPPPRFQCEAWLRAFSEWKQNRHFRSTIWFAALAPGQENL
jgi:hypothetical protein